MFAVIPVNAGVKFVHSGNPDGYDYTTEDFTINSMFHDLDLTDKIPENTKLVLLRVRFKSATLVNFLEFQRKGDYYHTNVSSLYSLVANKFTCGDMWVQPDENRVIEYAVSIGSDPVINVCIGGWFV